MFPFVKKSRFQSKIMILLLCWWFFAVTGTIINKKIIKQFPYPVSFSGFHLIIGGLIDYLILNNNNNNNKYKTDEYIFKFNINDMKKCLLNGIFFSLTKYLTYLSYKHVPVSLTHTIKSLSPIVSTISQYIFTRIIIKFNEFVCLIPIIFGVILSSINEIEFEMKGFISALIATVVGVLQNTTSKIVLSNNKNDINPISLHLYGSIISIFLLLPLSIIMEYSMYKNIFNYNYNLYNNIILSCIILYAQTMSSLYMLKYVNTVTHNVCNTCKRFWIIIISIYYFNREVNIMNYFGIFLAMFGFISYQHIHRKNISTNNSIKKINHKLRNKLINNYINKQKNRNNNIINNIDIITHDIKNTINNDNDIIISTQNPHKHLE